MAALNGFSAAPEHHERHVAINNARKVLDAAQLWGLPVPKRLPAGFARAMLKIPKQETLEDWLQHVETSANHRQTGRVLAEELRQRIDILPSPASGRGAGGEGAQVAHPVQTPSP